MPDDKMKQGGQQGREGQGYGQKTPGRNPQDDKSTQRSGGGANKEPMHDEGHSGGQSGQKGNQGQGGAGQKR
jgi:hypothetical protein